MKAFRHFFCTKRTPSDDGFAQAEGYARDKDETVSLPIAKDQMREIGSMNGKRLQEWPSRRNGEA